jgi:hypothetical protein
MRGRHKTGKLKTKNLRQAAEISWGKLEVSLHRLKANAIREKSSGSDV